MRQLPGDKYNVAWFKLAEFVARGEKERALGLYRLLIHTFEDKALAHQLQGDLLLSFNDEEAIVEYTKAAQAYEQGTRIMESTALYEHLITLRPSSAEFIEHLIDLYTLLDNKKRIAELSKQLTKVLLEKRQYEHLFSLLSSWQQSLDQSLLVTMYENIILHAAHDTMFPTVVVQEYLKKVVDFYVTAGDESSLHVFLDKLKALHEDYYKKACDYMQNV